MQLNKLFLKPSLFTQIRNYSLKKSSKQWVSRAQNDHYTKLAKELDYRSRAAFKLIELDDKYKFFKAGQKIVDLGFAPGAWTQVAVDRTTPNGIVLGVDIIPTPPPKGASAMQANILSKKTHELIRDFFLAKKIQQQQLTNDETNNSNEDKNEDESYIAKELEENSNDQVMNELNIKQDQFPIDVVISDMYEPMIPANLFWNNTTNKPYYRMANTSGLIAKDHLSSMVSLFSLSLLPIN